MFYRIFYTSWPQLLEPGRGGFGVVARHKQIPVLIVHAAEAASQFAHLRGAALHRVVYAYRTETTQSGRWHILSRIEDCGSDYTGRTNYLAQHLVADESTARHLAEQGISPARVMMDETAWPGFDKTVGFIEAPAWNPSCGPGGGGCWVQVGEDENPDRRYLLAIGPADIAFAYPAGWTGGAGARFVLGLFDEAACCHEPGCRPGCGWGTTFTTYLEPTDKPKDFTWIALPEDSSLLPSLRNAGNRLVYDQHSSVPPKPAHPQIPTATTNRKAPESAERQPTGRVVVSGQDRSSPLPPSGRLRPPTPQPKGTKISEQSGSQFAKWKIPAALLAGLLLLVVAVVGYVALFAKPYIEFERQTLSHVFDGKPKSAQLSSPAGARVSYLDEYGAGWSSLKPTNAGSYRLRVEFPPTLGGWWKPSPIELTNVVLRIEKAQVSIEMRDNQEFPYAKGQELPIVPIVDPEVASAQVKVSYASTIAPDRWTNDPYGDPGKYLVKAEIDSTSRNYKPVTKQAKYEITAPKSSDQSKSKTTESSASPQLGAPAVAESTKFEKGIWLADEKAMMGVLTNMPAEGNLYVYITDTNGAGNWSEIDRNHGTVKGAGFRSLFEMDKANKNPTKKTGRTSGPLVYMVGPSTNDPVFFAIEFQTSKASGSDEAADVLSSKLRSQLELFFKPGARLENINGKPCARFVLKDDSGFVGLEKFKTKSLGTTFVFEYKQWPFGESEKDRLKLDFTESGELDPRKIAELSATIEATKKPDEPSAAQSTNQDYFTNVKETFLAPLAEGAGIANTNNANPIAQQLYPVLKKLAPPAVADGADSKDVSKKSLAQVNHIVVETLVELTKNPIAYGLIDVSPDRKNNKNQEEQSVSGNFDPSLLAPAELNVEDLKEKSVGGIVDRAKKWIDGREGDIKRNAFKEEERNRADLLKSVLGDLRKGLNNLRQLAPQKAVAAPPDPGTVERERKAAEAKSAFLTKLEAGGPFDNEQGRLLFCVPSGGTAYEEYVLEPNLLLKPASK